MKFIVKFYDKNGDEIQGTIFDGVTEWESRKELDEAISNEVNIDYMLYEMEDCIIKEAKTNKKWYAYESWGSYFKLENGVLLECPMNTDGSIDESPCEIDWERGTNEADRIGLKNICKELEEWE